jgi:hypothetical protein
LWDCPQRSPRRTTRATPASSKNPLWQPRASIPDTDGSGARHTHVSRLAGLDTNKTPREANGSLSHSLPTIGRRRPS